MWELLYDRSDFARNKGAPADHTEKTGGITYPRATTDEEGEHVIDCFYLEVPCIHV